MSRVSSKSTLVPRPVLFEVSDACVAVLGKKAPAPMEKRSCSAGWRGTWAATGVIAAANARAASGYLRDRIHVQYTRRSPRAVGPRSNTAVTAVCLWFTRETPPRACLPRRASGLHAVRRQGAGGEVRCPVPRRRQRGGRAEGPGCRQGAADRSAGAAEGRRSQPARVVGDRRPFRAR